MTAVLESGAHVELNGLVIEGQVWIDASPTRVFEALTTPAWLAAWWGDEQIYTSSNWQIAAEPGSAWRCDIHTRNGAAHGLSGEVLEALPDQLLSLSWQASWLAPPPTEVRFELEPADGGTLLVLRHQGFRPDFSGRDTHQAGWPWVLRWLARQFPLDTENRS
ncbi:MAG: SRPBCC domain-containing protein [Burkholderiaceae bacterium]|nr:SRPBCC domain-containing protein [Burkholderiaceae bacterium]